MKPPFKAAKKLAMRVLAEIYILFWGGCGFGLPLLKNGSITGRTKHRNSEVTVESKIYIYLKSELSF